MARFSSAFCFKHRADAGACAHGGPAHISSRSPLARRRSLATARFPIQLPAQCGVDSRLVTIALRFEKRQDVAIQTYGGQHFGESYLRASSAGKYGRAEHVLGPCRTVSVRHLSRGAFLTTWRYWRASCTAALTECKAPLTSTGVALQLLRVSSYRTA